MATFDNVLGLRGRLGKIVFCRLNGTPYMRALPEVKNNPNTPKQQAVRSRFRVAVRFYQRLKDSPLKSILDVSAVGVCCSGYAWFMKKNLKAFRADGRIGDFSHLHFARGKRQQAYNLDGMIDDEGMVTLRWENGIKGDCSEKKDRLMVVALYSNRSFTPFLVEGLDVTRGACEATFRLRVAKKGRVHLYCFFASSSENCFSNSQYIGL